MLYMPFCLLSMCGCGLFICIYLNVFMSFLHAVIAAKEMEECNASRAPIVV